MRMRRAWPAPVVVLLACGACAGAGTPPASEGAMALPRQATDKVKGVAEEVTNQVAAALNMSPAVMRGTWTSPRGRDVVRDGRRFVARRHDDVDDRAHPFDRVIRLRSPFFTSLIATLRDASSIISSPNMTAPLRSPSVVAFS